METNPESLENREFILVSDSCGVECVHRGLQETGSWTDDVIEQMKRNLKKAGAEFREP